MIKKHTVTILENDLPITTKRFKGLHIDTVLESHFLLKFSDECQMRELVES